MDAFSLIVLVVAWLFALLYLPNFFKSWFSPLKLPPGPKPWPIIGNFNLLGPLPHQSLHQLSLKYGKTMQLHFGSYPVMVTSSLDMAKQILKTYDHMFASRPQTAAGKYTTYEYSDLAWAPYGPYWRQGRKIYLTELFSAKRLESYEYMRVEEMREFTRRLYRNCGKSIELKDYLSHYTLSIISRIVLGKKYFSASESEKEIVTLEEFQEMLDELFLLNGVLNIGDWIPWLDFLDLQGYVKRMKKLKVRFDKFHDHVIDEHNVRRKTTKNWQPKDMVDLLLQLADDPELEVKLTRDNIKGLTQDLIAGGTDTAATMGDWSMSELLKKPQLFKRVTDELDRVVGRERWVEEKDIPQLPYIEAIMKEAMRMHPSAVMLAPHLALQDCKVGGYDIPKGTRIFINTWSMGRDPDLWEDPEDFRPERFIGKGVDIKGHNFELLPFGSGRRMCPGYPLGTKMILVSLANMLHGFTWELPPGIKPEDVKRDEVFGLATQRKYPTVAVAKPRLPLHLYN
ncbi:hypothetical protein Peur_030579 [Populus x canadensis]|uniref:trimethyltridecatetraene synthase-like n=1 Tax=Populus nigra TaxID=3691 RepID=UPI002B2741CD|nr:trimethyltridecatetraene synthase-like [Populus nigra]